MNWFEVGILVGLLVCVINLSNISQKLMLQADIHSRLSSIHNLLYQISERPPNNPEINLYKVEDELESLNKSLDSRKKYGFASELYEKLDEINRSLYGISLELSDAKTALNQIESNTMK
jgi:hypothetical protein